MGGRDNFSFSQAEFKTFKVNVPKAVENIGLELVREVKVGDHN